MKRLLLAVFLLSGAPFIPSIATANPSKNVFVGNYGEVLDVDSDWGVQAFMSGNTEIVRFYPKCDTFCFERNAKKLPVPGPADYSNPANFTPKRLMQLVVYAKATSDIKTLKELRALREKTLKDDRIECSTLKEKRDTPCLIFDMGPGTNWLPDELPRESFSVNIKAPYKLHQYYYQTAKLLIIFSVGDPAGDGDAGAVKTLHNSLQSYLTENLWALERSYENARLGPTSPFKNALLMGVLVLVNLIGLTFVFRSRKPRLCLSGRFLLILTNLFALLGWSQAYLTQILKSPVIINESSGPLFLALLAPALCGWMSFRRGGRHPLRVVLFCLIPGIFVAVDRIRQLPQIARHVDLYVNSFPASMAQGAALGLIYALILSVFHSPKEESTPAA